MKSRNVQRRGSTCVLICVLMVPLLMLMAFCVDYGFLLFVRTDLQRVADQATIAAVRDLVPDDNGGQDLVAVRETIRDYVTLNYGQSFVVEDADIEIGRYNPATIYTSLELLNDGILDTVRITLRRTELSNNSVSLYFAKMFGLQTSDVSAVSTAVLQRARYIGPGSGVLPIAIQDTAWDLMEIGESVSIYGSGKIVDEWGNDVPGNWGTVDIGPKSNSTKALSEQIETGLFQSDLDSLLGQGAIPISEYIDCMQNPLLLNGDTGLSAGLRHAIEDAEGTHKVAPIYTSFKGSGGNLEFKIVAWTSVTIVDSGWNGSKNSFVEVRKSYIYDAKLFPVKDLSDLSSVIEGAYTSPVLVQ